MIRFTFQKTHPIHNPPSLHYYSILAYSFVTFPFTFSFFLSINPNAPSTIPPIKPTILSILLPTHWSSPPPTHHFHHHHLSTRLAPPSWHSESMTEYPPKHAVQDWESREYKPLSAHLLSILNISFHRISTFWKFPCEHAELCTMKIVWISTSWQEISNVHWRIGVWIHDQSVISQPWLLQRMRWWIWVWH